MAAQTQAAPPRLERGKAVSERTGIPLASLYRMAREGRFPKPFKISERSSAWDSEAVDRWITERIAASKKVATAMPSVAQSVGLLNDRSDTVGGAQ